MGGNKDMEKQEVVESPKELTAAEESGLPDVLQRLNNRHRDFVRYLALYDNPMKSYKLAGFPTPEGNGAYAYALAAQPHIQAGMEYWKEVFSSAAHTLPDKILVNMSYMANIDVTSYYNNQWQLKEIDELTEEQRQALTGVEVIEKSRTRTIKLKFAKLEANKELANIHRMYDDDKSKREGLNLTIQLGQQVNVNTTDDKPQVSDNMGLIFNLSQ